MMGRITDDPVPGEDLTPESIIRDMKPIKDRIWKMLHIRPSPELNKAYTAADRVVLYSHNHQQILEKDV